MPTALQPEMLLVQLNVTPPRWVVQTKRGWWGTWTTNSAEATPLPHADAIRLSRIYNFFAWFFRGRIGYTFPTSVPYKPPIPLLPAPTQQPAAGRSDASGLDMEDQLWTS